jgi:uncharacterized membrane protein YjgN (DUF898 family)
MSDAFDGGAAGAPALASAQAPEVRRFPVEFTGTGSEYFRIWIVNLLLTIVTLGIYSAWAKVRKMQYFYRNTRVDGAVFDYHGRPAAILKKRLIAFALLVAYNLAFQFSIVLGLVAAAALAIVMPWLLAQSQRFRLHNSSYRGLRFRFLGTAKQAYAVFGVPILVLLASIGWLSALGVQAEEGAQLSPWLFFVPMAGYLAVLLAWPWIHYRFKRYQHANSAYGSTTSEFAGEASQFYLYSGAALVVLIVAIALLFFTMSAGFRGRGAGFGVAMFVAIVAVYVLILGIGPYIAARVQNHVWNSTRLGAVGFDSAVQARRLIWIVVSNLLLIALTIGLYTPFAAVRAARYKLQSMAVLASDDLANFAGAAAAEVGAVGEGAADLFDVDFAL